MSDLLIPDVSEFQNVDFSAFSGPIIVRAHNGNRADNHWSQHSAGASRQPWWGAYQYLPANVDPTGAAQAFLHTLGGYKPNVTILDLEEGSGDQSGRAHAWLAVMATDPAKDWLYSGSYFARSHGLNNVDWLAAYQNQEPTTAHTLWQYSDAHSFPGIGSCDASVFHGTVQDLQALTSGTPTPPPPVPLEDEDVAYIMKGDANPQVWVTNLVQKRKVLDTNEVGELVYVTTAAGAAVHVDKGNNVFVWPQHLVDRIPTSG